MANIAPGWQPIETVKKGDFFKRKPEAKKVFVKQNYNASVKKYSANDFEDINAWQYFKKGVLVFIDFEF